MKKRIFLLLAAMILLLGAFAMNATAAEELAEVYVATTGLDTNAGTSEAPVLSLNKALELVQDGGTVHIVDSYTAPAGFVWDNHSKDVTITGGKLDLSAGYTEATEGDTTILCYYQGDAVTYDNLELVLVEDAFYFANGFRLQVNENVTVTCKDIQLFGGGHRTAVNSTNVKLLGGNYLCNDGYASIYGGGYKANVKGDIDLYVGGINAQYTTSHSGKTRLYGGGYSCGVSGDIDLTIAGANVDRIQGVSHNAATVSGDVNVLMSDGSAYSLYGGGSSTTVNGDIDLTIAGGTICQVFGANDGVSYTGNVTVKLQGGTITRRFFGGCYNNYEILSGYTGSNHVIGNIDVFLYEGMNLNWNTSEDDAGFYAHSRYNPLFEEEVSTIYYMGAAAQTKHADNLGSKNTGMTLAMGSSTAVADTVSVISATQVEKWNVVLGDDIGAHFYMNIPEAVAKQSVLKVTVAGETESYELSELSTNAEGLYMIPVYVAAAQMTEDITLQLVVDGMECEAVSYTVRDYAETILSGEDADDIKTLVNHMLNYGAAAQAYFNVNTGELANAGYELDYEAQLPTEYPALTVNGEISGVSCYGASLCMDSQVAVRYYFAADSVEGVTFTAGGVDYTAAQKNGMFYVEVPGIDPYEYADAIVLRAVKGEESLEVTYSPLTYIVRMSEKGSDPVKALVNAMYGYYEAAAAYVGQYSATVKLPTVTGGTVSADHSVYQIGQTVTVHVTPDAGYNLTALAVTKDGQSVDIGEVAFAGGAYTFTAELGSYAVEASFTEKIYQDTDSYDLTNQYNGTVTLKTGSASGQKVATYGNTYRDVAVTICDLTPDASVFGAEIHFNFTNGNVYSIRVEKKDGAYRIQNMDPDIVSSWPTVYWFNEAQTSKLQSEEGIEYRVTVSGTKSFIYLDGVCVGTQDLSAGITDETAQITLNMYGNADVENIEIPVALNSEAITSTIAVSAAENGTVTVDKESCVAGDTVTVTVTPNDLYNLTALKVMKDGAEVKSFETALEGGTYTFTTAAAGAYTVEAVFVQDHIVSAPDTNYVLRSAAVKYTDGAAYVERGETAGVYEDDPLIETLLTDAPGQFNAAGTEWIWIAYKVKAPANGTYTLGLTTNGAKSASYKIPMVVDHEVYTLTFTAAKQTVTTEVKLPAGEHIVTVFWPMPANESEVKTNDWDNYIWANMQSVIADYELTVCSAPTAAEVEAYVVPNKTVQTVDATTVLWSAAMGDNGNGYLEFNSRDAVKADMPYVDSLYSDAMDQFNRSGEEWGWFAYKVTAPADGVYTLKLQNQSCRNAPYVMPLCVDGEVYTLSYAATGRQSASVNVTLPAGEHTVVIFAPMPKNAESSTGTDYVDYPWANPEMITVDGLLTVSLPTVAEVENSFYTVVKGGDENTVLFNKFTDNGDTLGSISAGDIRWDEPSIDMLPYGSNYLSRWPYASVKVTAEKAGVYNILVNAEVNTATLSQQLGMLVDSTAYSVPFEKVSPTKMKVAVDLTAGEHVITFFLPMPKDHSAAFDGTSSYYPWMNYVSILFEYGLTEISKPTAQEIQANMLSYIPATDGNNLLWSATMDSKTENNVSVLYCKDQTFVRADLPYIDSLLTDAYGQFNNSGEEWNWFAYKVSAPETGTYSLGVMTQNAKLAAYKMPMYVNGQVYTLSFSAKTQAVTADVTLPKGDHVVMVFAPMPQNAESAANNVYNDYGFINYRAVIVDPDLTVSVPTVAEVEGAFLPNTVICAANAEQILHSATLNVQETYVGRTDQATLGVDLPTIDTLYTDASGQFNNAGEEWNWFAYKVTAPYDGVYTLGVKTLNAKYPNYLIPLCVNGEAHTLQFTATTQEVTARISLPAGEHTVVVFMPMRASADKIEGNYSNDFQWCDIESVTVDGELTVSLPTVEEVEACFAMETYSATDTSLVLRSAAVKYEEGNNYVERGSTTGVHEDTPRIDTLLELAPGNLNESGKEWLWIAYKVSIPKDGTYTLGITTNNCKYATYKLPMVVNGQIHTLSFTAKGQTVTTEVELPAGEHVVTVFWPMPEDETKVDASNANNYLWCNVVSVEADYSLTITAPTAAEVEACFPVVEAEEPTEETTEAVTEETTEEGLVVEETPTDDGTYGEIA